MKKILLITVVAALCGVCFAVGYRLGKPRPLEFEAEDLGDCFVVSQEINGKCAVFDHNGKRITEYIYDDILGGFSEGYTPAKLNGKWGYLNYQGTLVISNQFEEAGHFCQGRGAVKLNGKWGCVDRTGRLVIEAIYDTIVAFSPGEMHAWVTLSDQEFVIDRSGNTVRELE